MTKTAQMALLIIKTGFRELAKRFHPDVGGDADKMRELMAANEELVDLMEVNQ
jgi:curved DNA-binding protein CbpA